MQESKSARIRVRWTSGSGDALPMPSRPPVWQMVPVARWSLVMATLSELVRKRAIPTQIAEEVCEIASEDPSRVELAVG